MKRDSLSKRFRFELFKRDGFICQYCGRHPPEVVLELDHIVPVCEDGESVAENMITACFDCNRGKAGISLTSIPQNLKEKGKEIEEREAQIAGYAEIMQRRADRVKDECWSIADELFPGAIDKGLRRDHFLTIKKFNGMLGYHETLEAAEIAFAKYSFSDPKRFKYFCGVCWNKIKRSQQ